MTEPNGPPEQPDLAEKYRAAYAAVVHGVQGTCSLDIDGASKDEALAIACEFFEAAGRGYQVIKAAETETEYGRRVYGATDSYVFPSSREIVLSPKSMMEPMQRSVFRTAWLPAEQEGPR